MTIAIDQIDLADVDLDPRFTPRLVNANDHGAYLEAVHENTFRNLATIHLRLAKGDVAGATDMVKALREHIEGLWEQYRQAVEQGVAP